MATEEVLEALRGSFLGEQLSHQSLSQLASHLRFVDYPTNHIVFREGESASCVYVVVEGTVAIEIGSTANRIPLLTLGQGELLGWSPVLRQERATATARTLSPTRAVEIDVARLLPLFDSNKRLGYEFLRATATAMSKRLSATLMQLADVYGASQPTPPK